MPPRPVWRDGALVPLEDARVSVLSHAMQRGSLVFDVGALRETAQGGVACFRPREHIERFRRSASLVGIDVPWSAGDLLAATLATARASGLSSALVRWSSFLPEPEPDVLPRASSRASVVIAVIAPGDTLAPGAVAAPRPSAARVAIPRDVRKAGPAVFPPQAKVAAAYLGPMLAKRRAVAAGHDEVVLLDEEGRVAEAPTANVFAVRAGTLLTPPAGRILAGITRASVLELARAEGIPAREVHLTPEELASADEAFLVGTSLPVLPISTVDGVSLRGGAPSLAARIKALLVACERGEDKRFAHWIERV